MIHSYTVVNPSRITVQLERGPSKYSVNLRLQFHGEDGEKGEVFLIDYNVERAEHLFQALTEALEPAVKKAEAA